MHERRRGEAKGHFSVKWNGTYCDLTYQLVNGVFFSREDFEPL